MVKIHLYLSLNDKYYSIIKKEVEKYNAKITDVVRRWLAEYMNLRLTIPKPILEWISENYQNMLNHPDEYFPKLKRLMEIYAGDTDGAEI